MAKTASEKMSITRTKISTQKRKTFIKRRRGSYYIPSSRIAGRLTSQEATRLLGRTHQSTDEDEVVGHQARPRCTK